MSEIAASTKAMTVFVFHLFIQMSTTVIYGAHFITYDIIEKIDGS